MSDTNITLNTIEVAMRTPDGQVYYVTMSPKQFQTGTYGYHGQTKFTIAGVRYQVNLLAAEIGRKEKGEEGKEGYPWEFPWEDFGQAVDSCVAEIDADTEGYCKRAGVDEGYATDEGIKTIKWLTNNLMLEADNEDWDYHIQQGTAQKAWEEALERVREYADDMIQRDFGQVTDTPIVITDPAEEFAEKLMEPFEQDRQEFFKQRDPEYWHLQYEATKALVEAVITKFNLCITPFFKDAYREEGGVEDFEDPNDDWMCPYCESILDTETEWKEHVDERHPDEARTLEFQKYGLDVKDYQEEKDVIKGGENVSQYCLWCDKVTSQNITQKGYNEWTVTCLECGKFFDYGISTDDHPQLAEEDNLHKNQ